MKKIIYSLVIMIAAGSLFTSCVENTEPQGIRDLREAKADYLASLSKLREADAEKVKAEAAVEQAKAAVAQAIANLAQVAVEAAKIAVDLEDAAVQAKIAEIKAQAEYDAVIAEHNLAIAQDNLRKALANIAAEAEKLTTQEQQVVIDYKTAYDNYIDAQSGVFTAEKELWEATNEYGNPKKSLKQNKAIYEKQIADAKAIIADRQATIEEYESKSEADKLTYGIWKDEYDSYVDSVKYLDFQLAQIAKDRSYYKTEVEPAFQSFLQALKEAQKSVTKAVNAVGFKIDLTGDDAYELPKQDIKAGSVVEAFKSAVGEIITTNDNYVKVVDNKKLAVKADNQKAIAKQIFGDAEHPEKASLAGIIDALQREMVITDQYVKDTAGIGALVAATLADYNATKDTLVAGREAYEPYVKAKAAYDETKAEADQKVADASKAIDDLLTAIKRAQKEQEPEEKWALTKAQQDSIENGIINFGKAVYSYFGNVERDSVETYEYNSKTGEEMPKKVALKDITKDHFDTYMIEGQWYRNAFVPSSFAKGNIGDATVARYWSYNKILKEISGLAASQKQIVKWYKTITDIRSFKDETVAMWGIITRPAKATDAKTYYYVSADKQFKAGSVVFNYDKLDKKKSAKETAYSNFYTKIYEHFWGVKFNTSADSLVINFNEKTYTDPYLLPDFTKEAGFFTPSNKDAGSIDWAKVGLKSNAELDVISEQLKQSSNGHEINNLEVKKDGQRVNWTLYAKVLATAQFENEAKYYVENKEALEALAAIVEDVKDVYAEASENIEGKQALADSLVTEYVGEEVIEYLLGKELIENASNVWTDAILKAVFVVDPASTTQESFKTDEWIEDGEYNLYGFQLEAAEEYLDDYAVVINDWDVKEVQIAADKQYCNTLMGYLNTYVQALYKYKEGQVTTGNPDEVYEYLQNVWTIMINGLKDDIKTQEGKIEDAEQSLAKLAAGYDDQQVEIEKKEAALAKAQALLEQREVELAVAEAAYKAVLAAHGITE